MTRAKRIALLVRLTVRSQLSLSPGPPLCLSRLLPIALVSGLFVVPGAAQQTPQRDPQAILVLERALTALGGSAGTATIQDAVTRGHIQPSPGSATQAGSFVWKNSWVGGTHEFSAETQSDGDGERTLVVSGHGHPAAIDRGTLVTLPGASALEPAAHLPSRVLLAELNDPQYSFGGPTQAVVRGKGPAIRVHVELNGDTETRRAGSQDWFFDLSTWLPLRLEYNVPLAPDPSLTRTVPTQYLREAIDYSNFKDVGAAVLPFTLTTYEQDKQVAIITLESVTFNNDLTPSEFDVPSSAGVRP